MPVRIDALNPMIDTVLHDDYPRLRRSILRVIDAARAESDALERADAQQSAAVVHAWRQSHRCELDAMQALIAAFEVFDRRLTRACDEPDACGPSLS